MRRRIFHGDFGEGNYEHVNSTDFTRLNEPLLKSDDHDTFRSSSDEDEYEDSMSERKRAEELAWTNIFSGLIVQWAQWLARFLLDSGARLSGIILHSVVGISTNNEKIDLDLSPLQRERLNILQQRLEVPFDGSRIDHQNALRELWHIAFPHIQLDGLVSKQWKEMGWQGTDPSTDFRGAGFISLENLLFYAKNFPKSFQRLLHKQEGTRATWEYPFAIAGINISFVLVQMLDLRSATPSSLSGIKFLKLLAEDEKSFDVLYCIAFEILDSQWLTMRASYMEFNEVMKATQVQLERELSQEDVRCVQHMPSYKLLVQ